MNIIDNVKIAEQIITVPERIDYPQIRLTIGADKIQVNDIVALVVTVYNDKGVEKYTIGKKIRFKEFPSNKGIGVVGVAKLTVAEQPIEKSKEILDDK